MGSKNSWRFSFIDIDSSYSLSTEIGTIKGYMVVRAPKGETEPYYFSKGNIEAIEAMVGMPSAIYPDLYEVEAFNSEYDLYISAPAGSGSQYGALFLGTTGYQDGEEGPKKDPIVIEQIDNKDGVTEKTIDTFMSIVQKSPTAKKTGITITNIGYDKWLYDNFCYFYDGAIADLENVNPNSSIKKGDFIISKENLVLQLNIVESLTINPAQAVMGAKVSDNYTNKFSTVTSNWESYKFLVKEELEIETKSFISYKESSQEKYEIYVIDESKLEKMVEKTPENENENLKFLVRDPLYNTVTFKVTEEVAPGKNVSGGEFTGSLDPAGTDSYGANIYWPNVLNDDDMTYVEVKLFKSKFSDNSQKGIFDGKRLLEKGQVIYREISGVRTISNKIEDEFNNGTDNKNSILPTIKEGWIEAQDPQYDDVFIFIDPIGDEDIHVSQSKLVDTIHRLAIAVSPKVINDTEFKNPNKIVVKGRSNQCAQYVGEFEMYDPTTGKKFWQCPIGDVATMCCRIMDRKLGGWAPAWTNYQGLGGQLSRNVSKARWNFPESTNKTLDGKGLNPIVFNADDGLMITSSKTTADPSNLTDWNYLEHVMSFVLVKREIRDNVMRPQIKKPIDDYWMGIRKEQVDAILAKRLSGRSSIWTDARCKIREVNTPQTKAARKFIIKVQVKVTVFAEYVELVFENVGQTMNLD